MVTRNNYISKLKRHNEKALEFVVQEYGGQVKAAVYKNLSGMPEEIEECMDDVFLDVWNNIDRFDESKGSFRSWITAIARFRSIDYLRRYSRRCSEEDIADYENKLANTTCWRYSMRRYRTAWKSCWVVCRMKTGTSF